MGWAALEPTSRGGVVVVAGTVVAGVVVAGRVVVGAAVLTGAAGRVATGGVSDVVVEGPAAARPL